MSPPPQVVTTPYGRPALEALHRAVASAKEGDPLAPATVVVANNMVGLSARRLLAGGDLGPVTGSARGLAGVDFLTAYRLAERFGAASLAGAGRRPVSAPVIAAAVRAVLQDEPGLFARVAEHPTTERRLVAAHRELCDLDEASLDRLAGLSPRAEHVVRIHRRLRSMLAPHWYTEQDLVAAAVSALDDGIATAEPLGTVVVFLPQRLGPAGGRLLREVGRAVPVVVIAGLCGADDADATVRTSLSRLGVTQPPPAPPPAAPPPVEVLSVSDADDEVRHVVRGIVDAARQGIPFDRMAVVYASDQPYVRLLHDRLAAAGIPRNGSAVATVGESAVGRVLRRFLSLAERGYRREDVIGLLASSPIRWRGRLTPTRAWDQISRRAGVVKGADDWQQRLGTFVADARSEIELLGRDPEQESRVNRRERDIELAEALRTFMDDLVAVLQEGDAARGWRARTRWCARLLHRYVADRAGWPDAERLAAERVDAILDRLAGLDAVEPDPTPAVFRRTLDLELDGGLGRVGSFGDGVLVGPARISVGLELDRVWVLGMSEGSFPSRPSEDSLLPDRERRETGILALRAERTGDEHRQLLATLATVGPGGRATLLYPRGDLRQSHERAPSRWLGELVQAGEVVVSGSDLERLQGDWIRHVPSSTAGILDARFPATHQEHGLRLLADELDRAGHLDARTLAEVGDVVVRGAALQAGRDGPGFTRFDGNLSAAGVVDPVQSDRPLSATALETWAGCPYQYFARYLLGVEPLDTPELRLRIDPLSKGSLVHRVLERFVHERLAGDDNRPGRGWSAAERERLQGIASEEFAAAEARGVTGEPLYWRRDQVLLRRDLARFAALDHDRRTDERLRPLATELGFGLGSEPASIELGDGRTIRLRGSIDLVDETARGDLVVIDYKTGRETRLTEDDPHQGGTRLQLVLYALAARQILGRPHAGVHSYYWHLRERSRYCRIGYPVTAAVESEVLRAVRTIIDDMAAGVFPQHPDETTRSGWVSCAYCDPDGLGVAEARRRLSRKAAAPELTAYLLLAEPSLVPPSQLPELEERAST